jgi:phage minor structural protein
MGQLYVFEPWPTAVDTMGLCGPLTPKKAVCVQEKNGDFRLDIEHPIDEWGKWANLAPGNLVKAKVPLRTLPITTSIVGNIIYQATVASVNRDTRGLYADSAFTLRLATLDVGEYVYKPYSAIGAFDIYARVVTAKGVGFVRVAALTGTYTQMSIANNAAGIEAVVPSIRSREQLFRISSVAITPSGVSAVAHHVFYDNLGNVTNYTTTPTGCEAAVDGLANGMLDSRVSSHAAVVLSHKRLYSPAEITKDIAKWIRVSPVEALLAPSSGVVSIWNYDIARDNWHAHVVSGMAIDRGFAIEHGKNMLGVTYSINHSDIISQIIPVGQTSKGKPLTVPTGTYTVDGVSVSVVNGVVSSENDTYPIPHIAVLDKGSEIKAAGTDSTSLNAAYTKLIRAAKAKFADEQCDLPEVTLRVDFVNLGDTAEYAQYRDLQKLFLYDTVRVKHPPLGIDVTTQVNKTEWDCLLDRYNSIELGSVRKNYARTRFASWQVPGLASLRAYVDTITSAI